ncbi:MAG: MobF family relaxase [Actinomycetes bacterium]
MSSAKISRSSWRYYQRTVAGGACEYYAEHGDAPGRWHGSGLPQLGLTAGAEVAERELEALFGRALSPSTGVALGSPWRADAVTGYDLTFSAPKSVSALWALGDTGTGEVLVAAHDAAVTAALGYLERHASLSRRGRDGVEQIASAGFAAACFEHHTSRTGDPQLHTHALVVNKVHCTDGAWRTLDGHEVYHHKKAAGAIYQTALRAELTTRLPVAFGPVSEHGQAEITGVPDELLSAWSTRTSAVLADAVPTIADAEAALGRPVSAAERARIIKTAVLATRPVKDTGVDEGDLRARWVDQAAALGWDADRLTHAVNAAAASSLAAVGPGWEETVARDAVSAVGRSKAIWSRADLTVAIAARIPTSGPGVPETARDAALVAEALANATLDTPAVTGAVALGADQSGHTSRASDDRYASQELVETEARILERAISGGFRPHERLDPYTLAAFYTGPGTACSVEQRAAAVHLVASRDLITVMAAPAGAGKTTTLATAVARWVDRGHLVTALAPSARAAAELQAATGARGQTVARWLAVQARSDQQPFRLGDLEALSYRSVIVVDEASMLTTADLDQLTARAAAAKARVVLVGDPAQIGAVNAPGGMFEHLTHVLATRRIDLTELHRFRNEWEAAATLRLRDGDPSVLTVYADHGRIHPETSSEDAADAVFDRWRHATEQGADALMLARSWTDVTALNTRARAVGIATGAITGPDLTVITSRTPSTRGQAQARGWRAGDVLIAKKNTTITVGADTLRNSDRFRVLAAATGGGLLVEDLRGRGTTTLPAAYLARHAEYGWAATIDGAQGATADIGIVLARTGLDREHLYVAMTRGRYENHVHTTPDTPQGDAGPHRHTPTPATTARTGTRPAPARRQPLPVRRPAPTPPSTQLAPPHIDAALTQLARAVSSSGRERAAHALLDPPAHAARQLAWALREATRPPEVIPREHERHQGDLDRARVDRDHAQQRLHQAAARMRELEAELAHTGIFGRKRRAELTTAVTRSQALVTDNLGRLEAAEEVVTRLAGVVDTDTTTRATDHDRERQDRYDAWASRPDTVLHDPNPHTGDHDPRPIVAAEAARAAARTANRSRTPNTPMRVSHDSTHHSRGPDHHLGI